MVLKKPNGTIFHTQQITQPNVNFTINEQFLTGSETSFTIEITTDNNLGLNGQQNFIDNLSLQVASKAKIEFAYNDRGQRVSKQSYVSNTHKTLTYYVRDLSGNVMAVYEGSQTLDPSTGAVINNKPANITEHSIFGSGRIGIFKPSYSNFGYLYELTDHLGNVRAVITSGVRGQLVSLTNKTDYYPFGMPLPNQQITDQNYRYAFQGQEKDPETGMEAFELRLWL